MNRRKFIKAVPPLVVLAGTAASYPTSDGEGLKPVILPTPEKEGGKYVLASLAERKTTRSISSREIPEQVLSNLLWSAFGVNRNTASFGLAAWFHNCDKTNTVREFKLRTTQKVLFAQTIGYPE
jgi:hypothetical protein